MIKKLNKKTIIITAFILLLLGLISYGGKGAWDYYDWMKTKEAVAGGGFTNLYAGTLGAITMGCTYTQSGCTCSFCNDCGCNTYDQAIIVNGQEVNKGATNLCVSNTLQVKGTPLINASGKQFITGSMTGKCLTANAVMATPSMAATNFERFVKKTNEFYIAGKKMLHISN